MKLVISTLFFLSIFNSCKTAESHTENNFDFLKGEWIRTNEKVGRQTFESWKKLNKSTYLGCSYTLQNKDTIFQEHMTLVKENGDWNLKVKLNKNTTETTDFKMISQNKNSFTVENQQNDFPKTIKYWKNDKNLSAEISNNGENPIQYEFKIK